MAGAHEMRPERAAWKKGLGPQTAAPRWAARRRVHFEPRQELRQVMGESSGESPPLRYHGGAVQHQPHIYAIFWGASWSEDAEGVEKRGEIEAAYEALSGSAYEGILTQYFDATGRVSPTVQFTSYNDIRKPMPASLTDADFRDEVAAAISENGWSHGLDDQFVVLPGPGASYDLGKTTFCAYHAWDKALGTTYTWVPFPGDWRPGCNNTIKSITHEYAESATDPRLDAWRGSLAEEIADLCEGVATSLGGIRGVETLWDDSLHECTVADPEPPQAMAFMQSTSEVAGTVTLRAGVYPQGRQTTYHFEYGHTAGYGESAPAVPGSVEPGVSVNSAEEASARIEGLTEPGTYHVRVVASNESGTFYGSDATFVISGPPVLSFSVVTATPVAGRPVAFDARASSDPEGVIERYEWDFGDGQHGVGEKPTHTYAQPGSYRVTVTAVDAWSGAVTYTHTVSVAVRPPAPSFSVVTATPVAGRPVAFDARASSDPEGVIERYEWDFGDGQHGVGITPTHTYARAGSYRVTLTAIDARSGDVAVAHTVSVAVRPPVLSFSVVTTTPVVDQAVGFDAGASSDPEGVIERYEWDFGDGQHGVGMTPTHTYGRAGSYRVTLTAVGARSGGVAVAHTVSVAVRPPVPSFSVVTAEPVAGQPVGFDAGASSDAEGPIERYEWDFGDGQHGVGATPTHTYAHAGYYSVKLTVDGYANASAHVERPVAVGRAATGGGATAGGGTAESFAISHVGGTCDGRIQLSLHASGAGGFVAKAKAVVARGTRRRTLPRARDRRKSRCVGVRRAKGGPSRRSTGRHGKHRGRVRLRRIGYGSGHTDARGVGRTRLVIRPTRAALRTLRRQGTLRVRVIIRFRARSGAATSKSVWIVVREKRPRAGSVRALGTAATVAGVPSPFLLSTGRAQNTTSPNPGQISGRRQAGAGRGEAAA